MLKSFLEKKPADYIFWIREDLDKFAISGSKLGMWKPAVEERRRAAYKNLLIMFLKKMVLAYLESHKIASFFNPSAAQKASQQCASVQNYGIHA